MKFPRTKKNIKFVNIPMFGKKIRKIWKIEKLREKNVENLAKKSSDKNDPLLALKKGKRDVCWLRVMEEGPRLLLRYMRFKLERNMHDALSKGKS